MCCSPAIPSGAPEQQTTTVLENVAVIATGQKLERNTAGEPQVTPVITLLVSPDDAQKLTLATTPGQDSIGAAQPARHQAAGTGFGEHGRRCTKAFRTPDTCRGAAAQID